MKMIWPFHVSLVLFALLISCTPKLVSVPAKTKPAKSIMTPPVSHGQDLKNTRWVLVDVPGKTLSNPSNFIIAFFDDSKISGSTGCNYLIGEYTLKNDHIEIRAGSSEKGCPGELGVLQGAGMAALGRANRYKMSADSLQLFDSANTLLANFKVDVAP